MGINSIVGVSNILGMSTKRKSTIGTTTTPKI
jgi:hypothetical protein